MVYTKLDIFIIVTSAIMLLVCYIGLKASGTVWWGIQWGKIFRAIRKWWKSLG